jgi:hypothetical protein
MEEVRMKQTPAQSGCERVEIKFDRNENRRDRMRRTIHTSPQLRRP